MFLSEIEINCSLIYTYIRLNIYKNRCQIGCNVLNVHGLKVCCWFYIKNIIGFNLHFISSFQTVQMSYKHLNMIRCYAQMRKRVAIADFIR